MVLQCSLAIMFCNHMHYCYRAASASQCTGSALDDAGKPGSQRLSSVPSRYFQLPKKFLEQLQQPGDGPGDLANDPLEDFEQLVEEGAAPAARSPAVERQPQEPSDPLEVAAARLAERLAQSSAAANSGAAEAAAQPAAGAAQLPDQWDVFNDMADEWCPPRDFMSDAVLLMWQV